MKKNIIPNFIHIIWLQGLNNMPLKLKQYYVNCKNVNHNFRIIFWNNKKIISFIKNNYTKKFIDFYNQLIIPAQKADFARYCILNIIGGIYLDADMVCKRNLSPFLKYSFFLTKDVPLLNFFYKRYLNGIIGSIPYHPIFKIIFKNIFKRKNYLNDVTFSTGTKLIYDSVQEFKKEHHKHNINIINPKYLHPCPIYSDYNCEKNCKECYVVHMNNGSWNSTIRKIKYIRNNYLLIIIIILSLLLIVYYLCTIIF